MDLIRKISSGLRSSQDLSAAVAQVKNDDAAGRQAESKTLNRQEEEEGNLLHGTEQDDADVFEDAAPALRQRQQQSEEEEEKKPGNSVQEDQQETPAGASPIRVRAPVSDEHGELEDDHDNVEGMEEEEEEDGEASHGSGESFDSALERMAASSEASYDTAVSPKVSSPVGSLTDPAVPGNPSSVMSVSQQGAANGLHETFTGESFLDTSVADKSTREKSGNGELSEGPGQSVAAEAQAMPKANLTAEDEDGYDERDEDELSGDGQPEEENEEPTEDLTGDADTNRDVPLKIRAVPSDLNDNVSIPHTEFHGEAAAPEENRDEDNESLPLQVRAPASEPDSDSSFDAGAGAGEVTSRGWNGTPKPIEEIQARPFAKLSDLERANVEEDNTLQEKLPEEILTEGIVNTMDTEALEQASNKPAINREETDKILSDGKGDVDDDGEDGDKGENDEEYEEDEEDEEDSEEDGDEAVERSAALAALVRAADATAGAEPGPPLLGAAGPSLPARPTRSVRSSVPSLEPAPRVAQQPRSSEANPTRLSSSADGSQATTEIADGNEETREKLQGIRVKFLRLALRLGQSAQNVVVSQVLYRLGLAEQLRGGRSNRNAAFSFDRASAIAEEQEAAGQEELDFSCTIMMLGKTGVGKSATINSIFDEAKTGTNAFSPATNKVQIITGHVHGIKVRVIDTPGLLPSVVDQRHNEKIMASVKGVIKKQSPDIVLYFDRLDMQSRDFGDLPLLRTITDTFGAAVWFNAIVVLTHASSAPPDGPNGIPLSYEMFVAHRSHVVQHTIRQAAGDMRLMNPVSLVENHTACRVNRSGQRVLPNGQVWKPQLLLLCFASKILAEANALLKLQDNTPGRPFGTRSRVPPLPFLLSSLLQSRAQLKLSDEQMGDEDESDEELDDDEDSDEEEDYDQLPPFRRLAKEEIDELDEINRGNYFEELAERERLFQKKQWKEEVKRRRELKRRMAEAPTEQPQFVDEGVEDDMARSAAVPVPMPDMVLPPSFDSDNPSHRYRYLETANQWLVRPVLETHGWDHDSGYDGMSVEKVFVIADKVPTSVSGQITKDKKEANLNMECAASLKHGEGKVTLAGLDLQTVGKDVAYTLRSETRFSNFKGNKTTGGLALTLLGDTVSAGMKIEDRLIIGKRVKLVVNGGAITGAGDVAYGGSLEATLRNKEYPLSRTLSTLGVSIMNWHGDLAVGGNLQSQFILGKTMMVGRANLNNRGAGQISIRASSSEQLQMTLIGLLPIIRTIVNRLFGSQPQQ